MDRSIDNRIAPVLAVFAGLTGGCLHDGTPLEKVITAAAIALATGFTYRIGAWLAELAKAQVLRVVKSKDEDPPV